MVEGGLLRWVFGATSGSGTEAADHHSLVKMNAISHSNATAVAVAGVEPASPYPAEVSTVDNKGFVL